MSDYIHLFSTTAARDAVYNGSGYTEPWVSLVTANNKIDYNKSKYYSIPLTFDILTSGQIKWCATETVEREGYLKTISYKINNGSWTNITASTNGTTSSISVSAGDKISFAGDNPKYAWDYDDDGWSMCHYFNCSDGCTFNVYGNLSSLLDSTNFATLTEPPAYDDWWTGYCYPYLFYNCGVISAKNLIIMCDESWHMFENCTSLVEAPNIYAVSGYNTCASMFAGCTSLRKAPKLLATELTYQCYQAMFSGCTSLTAAPELPATTLTEDCYNSMFENCTSLTTAPDLPATTLADRCYSYMFNGCTSLTSVPMVLPATTLAHGCYSGMYDGCTSLTTAPELPATTLAEYCYYGMFEGCTSLTSAPELPATTLASNCYQSMFESCTSLTTAPELPATELIGYCYQNMFYGCSNLSSVTCLATNISASNCVSNWLSGVSSTGTFTKAASMTSWPSGTSGIPSGWTVQDAS